jgi:hypothetical protein
MIQNPYRKGKAAGAAHAEAFIAWRTRARETRNFSEPRPVTPTNPYSTPFGQRQWADGYRDALRQRGLA